MAELWAALPIVGVMILLIFGWRFVQAILHVVRLASVSIALLAGAGFLLLVTSAGLDLTAQIGRWGVPMVWFTLGTIYWSLQSWYWARRIIEERYGEDDLDWRKAQTPAGVRLYHYLAWLPRALSVGPFLIGLLAMYAGGAMTDEPLFLVIYVPLAIAILAFLWRRRAMFENPEMAEFGYAIDKISMAVGYGVAVAGVVMTFVAPVGFAQAIGPAAVVFFAFGAINAGVGTLKFVAMRLRHTRNADGVVVNEAPLIVLVLLWIALVSAVTDNNAVRTLPATEAQLAERIDLRTAFKYWNEAAGGDCADAPIVMVAAAGGASRAGFWTGMLLDDFDREIGCFKNSVFALSGVSGGTLGLAGYAAQHGLPQPARPAEGGPNERSVMYRALKADFLSPTMMMFLFRDMLNLIVPFNDGLREIGLADDDRSVALERAMTAASREFAPDAPVAPFDRAYTDYAPTQDRWRPILLFNGTHEQTGKRIVTSTVRVGPDLVDAVEFHDLVGSDLRLATAITNAARFPLVTPPGRLEGADGERFGHILDGGYFENSGMETLIDVLLALRTEIKGRRVILIEISADPQLSAYDAVRTAYDNPRSKRLWDARNICKRRDSDENPCTEDSALPNEIMGPVNGVLQTRTSRGVLAGKRAAQLSRLKDANFAGGLDYFIFSMRELPDDDQPALNWVLSDRALDTLTCLLPNYAKIGMEKICADFLSDSDEQQDIADAQAAVRAEYERLAGAFGQ